MMPGGSKGGGWRLVGGAGLQQDGGLAGGQALQAEPGQPCMGCLLAEPAHASEDERLRVPHGL